MSNGRRSATSEEFFGLLEMNIINKEYVLLPDDDEMIVAFMDKQHGLSETKTISRDDLTEAVYLLRKAFNEED